MGFMRRIFLGIFGSFFLGGWAFGAALGTSAREVIPAQVQQIIAVDYRALANSQVATELHDRVLPPDLKEFETALKGVGILPQRDIDHLAFASFRDGNQLRFVGVADGEFALKQIFNKLKAKKIKPAKFSGAWLYPMGNGFQMTLLDDSTLLFGNEEALHSALEARAGDTPNLGTNSEITDIMPEVDGAAVWSVLDQQGTQTMLRSALGDAAKLADYDTVSKRLKASRYQMNFEHGVNFDLDVITSDSFTATSLSSLMRAGVMFKKMQASAQEKPLFDAMSVDSDGDLLRVHFKTDDKQFQSLLNSQLFASVAR
jgi:hypothetical protein